MRKYRLILGLLVINSILFGQDKKLKIEIDDCLTTKNSISFCLRITNISNQPITTYLPKKNDICYGLIKIPFIDLQNHKSHNFFPCTSYAADLDCITIDCKNSLFLKPNEKYNQDLKLLKKDVFPHLIKGKHYKFFVEWYLEGICFKTDSKSLIQENIKSNEINIKI
ncbi:hypothetical protein RDV77_01055 [Porphyromonadaceae sp. NP-X]|nr:hypothetical protein [Porphyromonadaceae sp. NP-X]